MLLRSNCLRHIQNQNLWKCQAQLYQLSDTTFYSTSSVFHNLSSLTQTHAVISSPKRIIFFLTKWSFIGLKSFTTTKHQITSDFVLSMDNFSHWAKLEPLSERQHPWGDLGLCALLKVTISGYQPLVNRLIEMQFLSVSYLLPKLRLCDNLWQELLRWEEGESLLNCLECASAHNDANVGGQADQKRDWKRQWEHLQIIKSKGTT